MNAFQKYLLYKELLKQLKSKAVAAKKFESHDGGNSSQVEWRCDKYAAKAFKNETNYWTRITTTNGELIATFTNKRANKLYTAAYWLAIEQAPAKARQDMMQIDRAAIDFAFGEISAATRNSR